MPRKPRFKLPGTPQHIIQRGNNRMACFFCEQDYLQYLEDLSASAGKYQCRVHAYVLMTNHIHLLVTPDEPSGISRFMQALGRRYAYYVNQKYKRTGTLWEGRYKACLVDSEAYLLTCMRYIELNPVRAGMVEKPGNYPWSSYRSNAIGEANDLIKPHTVYLAINQSDLLRLEAYREMFRKQINKTQIDEIRKVLNHELVLGRSWYKDRIEQQTQRQTRLGKPGRPITNNVAENNTPSAGTAEKIAL